MNNKKNKGSAGLSFYRIICYIVLVFLTILCLFSFYILLVNSSRAHVEIMKGFSIVPGNFFLNNFNALIHDPNLPVVSSLINSLVIAASTAILTTYFSSLTAYAIHAYHFKGKKAVFTFILMIMMVPTQVTALGFVELMRDMHLMNNFIPLIVPGIAAPIVFFFMKQYMDSSLPIEIIEAARIDGSSEFRAFNKIVIPIMKPAIAVQMIFSFTASWNNYFTPSLLLNEKNMKTLPILIAQIRSADFLKFNWGEVYMAIVISILPILIVYFILSKHIVQGIAIGSVKG